MLSPKGHTGVDGVLGTEAESDLRTIPFFAQPLLQDQVLSLAVWEVSHTGTMLEHAALSVPSSEVLNFDPKGFHQKTSDIAPQTHRSEWPGTLWDSCAGL